MRRGTSIFLAAIALVVIFLTYECSTLISLLFETGAAYAIPPSEIPAPGAEDTRPQLIPKIIHQTYIDENIPQQWQAGQQACKDLHPDYKYIVCSLQKHNQTKTSYKMKANMM